ncbi:MAG TPA: response regulator [Bryobacteraceae bacterium]|nr:response regulator [Bryobacteraceae bacterium]
MPALRKSKAFFRLLVADDNPADIRLLKEAFLSIATPHCIHAVEDGEEALDYLFARGNHAQAPRPDIVLLDINMPKRNGHDVLQAIKSDATLKHVVVLMFSGSAARSDVLRAYTAHANSYVAKPQSLGEYFDLAKAIDEFWGRSSLLPQRFL